LPPRPPPGARSRVYPRAVPSATRRSIDFTRDGSRAAIRTPAGVYVVDVSGATPPVLIPGGADDELAVVGDEVWIATGTQLQLRRYTLAGAQIGEPTPLWGLPGEGRLTAVAVGNAAVWTAPPATAFAIEGDALTAIPIVGEADCVVPVSATRWLLCNRDRLTLREPTTERWSTLPLGRDARVLDGAILFEGRSAALVVMLPPPSLGAEPIQQLVVVGLHDGRVQHRLTLASVGAVRLAAIRGFGLVRAGMRRLLLIDLRFGRVVKEHHENRDIVDLAIDPTAQNLALRFSFGPDDVVHMRVKDLMAATAKPAEPAAEAVESKAADADGKGNGAAAVEAPADVPAIDAVVARASARPAPDPTDAVGPPFHLGHAPLRSVVALQPRATYQATGRSESVALLERYRGLVSALVGRAIAQAWDEGRLTYPNEGTFPFKLEVAGILGRANGRAAEDLQEAEQDVVTALTSVRVAEAATGARTPPLVALSREFGLSAMARQLLMVAAAPGLWGEIARLYGILANDEGRPLCDELLVCQILGHQANRHDIARELDRDAPLVRYGLLRAAEGRMRPFVPIAVEPLVLRLLRGTSADGELEDVTIVPASRSFEDLLIPAKVKDHVVTELAQKREGGARIVIRGRVGSGRHTLLATLATAANRRLGVIDAAPIVRDLRNRMDSLRGALQRAHLLGLLPCIDGLESLASDDHAGKDGVRDLIRTHPGPVAIRLPWDAQPPIEPGYIGIDLPALSIDQRVTAWNVALAQTDLYVRDPGELAMRYAVGAGVVSKVAAEVGERERGRIAPDPGNHADADAETDGKRDGSGRRDVAPQLETAIRQHLENRLGATATRVHKLSSWAQVVLPPDIQDSLLELIARIRHRRTVYDTWGFDQLITTSRGVTALFQGGPGTGKTLVASAIANELGMDLYRVDLSRIMSKWIGETEQNLAKLFDAAEDGHAIILFDEADSLFAKRTEVRTSVDRYANLEVNYLLQRLDSFEGIAILTTNFGTAIDSAFKRRLSFRLTFPFPDEEMREQIWKAHIPPEMPKAGDFDLGGLARRYRLSGGYIRNATLRAAFLAAEEHVALTQDHLERAIKAEFREIGKLADSGVLE
jgi:hypothetical protein